MKYLSKQLVWPRFELGIDHGAPRYILFVDGENYLVFRPQFTIKGIKNPAKLSYINISKEGTQEEKIFEGRLTKKSLKLFEEVIKIFLNYPNGLDVTKLDRNKTAYL